MADAKGWWERANEISAVGTDDDDDDDDGSLWYT